MTFHAYRSQTCPGCQRNHVLMWEGHLATCGCGRTFDYWDTLEATREWVVQEFLVEKHTRPNTVEATGGGGEDPG